MNSSQAPEPVQGHASQGVEAVEVATHIVATEIEIDVVSEGDAQGPPREVMGGIEVNVVEISVDRIDRIDAVNASDHDHVEAELAEDDLDAPQDEIAGVATQGALPLDVRTGDAGVDAAVGQLQVLDELPVADHADVFTTVHRALQDALVDLDRN